jgi:hypothetical protein
VLLDELLQLLGGLGGGAVVGDGGYEGYNDVLHKKEKGWVDWQTYAWKRRNGNELFWLGEPTIF